MSMLVATSLRDVVSDSQEELHYLLFSVFFIAIVVYTVVYFLKGQGVDNL